MSYTAVNEKLQAGTLVILDGGTGTELERRGAAMDPDAWCGPATLANVDLLVEIHKEYIAVGSDVITANTFASSRIMLAGAGQDAHFEDINRTAVRAALRAREEATQETGSEGVAVAGSLSHMLPVVSGTDLSNPNQKVTEADMQAAFSELAQLHKEEGCDLILLEMMYHPDRMRPAFEAAAATGLPYWAGFSVRRGDDGQVLSFARDMELPFGEMLSFLKDFNPAAAGIMHSSSDVTGDALKILAQHFDGPLTAYPDSGYFKMPDWQFENIIEPAALADFGKSWINDGARVLGGCCGLSPKHIHALANLRA